MSVPPERIEIRFEDPTASMRVVDHRGELLYIGDELAFVDARQWPPAITHHRRHRAHDAARSGSGRWLVYGADRDNGVYVLRWFDIAGARHAGELAEPVPWRDFSSIYDALPVDRRAFMAPRPERLETVHVLGERAVAIPLHVGVDRYQRPFVERGGTWTELELPPYERPNNRAYECRVGCTQLSDGTDVLGWNGRLWAYRDGRMEPWCDAAITVFAMPWMMVPSARGTAFMLDRAQLVELGPRGRVEHLPGRSFDVVKAGPRGTLLVQAKRGWSVYDPARDTIASIAEQIGASDVLVSATDDYLLVHDTADATLRRVRLDETSSREIASIAPIAPPVPAVDAVGAVSRAQIAARGTDIVNVLRYQVRYFAEDTPAGLVELPAPVVAVARSSERTAALDAVGFLHLLDGTAIASAIRVTPEPRALAALADDRWLVIGGDGVKLVDGATITPVDSSGGIAAAVDPSGAVVLVGERNRLALYENGSISDLPHTAEQIIAIAPLGERRFVCAGQSHLFVLDLARPELELWIANQTSAQLATDIAHRQVAYVVDHEVFIVEHDSSTPRVRARFHRFELAEEATYALHGLLYLDDGRLVVGLPHGAGVILDFAHTRTKRMDPHPGDPRAVFTFSVDEQRLIG